MQNEHFCVQPNHEVEQQNRRMNKSMEYSTICWAWWRIGRVDAFRPDGRGFESRSNHNCRTENSKHGGKDLDVQRR